MGFALSNMQLTSTAFADGGFIPTKHTGEGPDVSPELSWSNAPAEAEAFALFCHDPDAPLIALGQYGYVHWVLYGIPGDVRSLPEGSGDFSQGVNDFGNRGYGGPMPPSGHGIHRYFFWLLALTEPPDLHPGLTLWQMLNTLEPNVIAMNRLMGLYRRD